MEMFLHNDDVLKTITVISWKNKGRPDSIVFATAIPCFSDFLNGMNKEDGMRAAIDHAVKNGFGRAKVNFKLRDWVFSRQRYWGEPIPMVYCEHCGWQPVPESELPLKLPQVPDYHPNDEGESPLSKAFDWVNTTCPKCGGKARRESPGVEKVYPVDVGSHLVYAISQCMGHRSKVSCRPQTSVSIWP